MRNFFLPVASFLTLASISFAEVPILDATQLRKLEPTSSVNSGNSGRAVTLRGGQCLVGAPGYRSSATKLGGGAFFHRAPIWAPEPLLNTSVETGDSAGQSVSFSGRIAAVGVPKNDDEGPDQGKVLLYAYDSERRAWIQFQQITAPVAFRYPTYFGQSVSMDGDRLLVGAPAGINVLTHGSESGAAYLYEPDTKGEWQHVQTLNGPAIGDLFGYSVSLQGSRALIGAPCSNSSGGRPVRSGSAFVYQLPSRGSWELDEKIDPSKPGAGDSFGFSVDLDSSHALIGAPNDDSSQGSAALFQKRIVTGWNHVGTYQSDSPQDGEFFGISVSIDDDIFVVGSPSRQVNGVTTGAVIPFWRTGGSWERQGLFTSDDGQNNDSFGAAVSIEGTQVLVGAPFDDENLNNSGAAFLFSLEEKDANKAPTAIALDDNSVPEDAANGTVVGTLSTTDPNVGQTFTYALLTNAGGKFALGGPSNDQILVADSLDFETRPSHSIQVETTDDCGLSFSQSLVISVEDVETPVTITLGNLTQTYTGTPRNVSHTTSPPGVPVDITYVTQSGAAPVNAGSYLVTISAQEGSDYTGSQSATLIVQKAEANLSLGNLTQTYSGTGITPTVTTSPADLPVDLFYNGQPAPPVNAASYVVDATINHPNYEGSAMGTLTILKAPATVAFTNLNQTYNGFSRTVSASTSPPNLSVSITYNGSSNGPVNAGTYDVVGTINEPNYQGSGSGSFVISKAVPGITLANLAQTYNGSPRIVTATTTPAGLDLSITYDGSVTPPVDAGSYAVIATVDDENHAGTESGTLVVSKASTTVILDNLTHTHNGQPKSATATTVPNGLNVTVTYNGNPTPPSDIGSYAVVAIVVDENYTGSASGTLSINASGASIFLANLSQTYDGTAKLPTVTTTPDGLSYTLTFDGSPAPPVNAGSYQVTATISEQNYPASSTVRTLLIRRATQTITFPQPDDMLVLETQQLEATSSSGLPVTFSTFGQNTIDDQNQLTPYREGEVTIRARQEGNINYRRAQDVTRSIQVGPKSNLIIPSEPGLIFGLQMDLWQDQLVISQIGRTPGADGKAFLFEKSVDGSWRETFSIPSTGSRSVAIYSDLLTLSDTNDEAVLYHRIDDGTWERVDSLPHESDRIFSISNDIIYTASFDEARANIRLSNGEWWTSDPMIPSGGERIHGIDSWGETCVISCDETLQPLPDVQGVTYLFERSSDRVWKEVKRIEHRSSTIAISGNHLAIGNRQSSSSDPGAVISETETVVYRRENGEWIQDATLIPEGEFYNTSPLSLSLFGDHLVLGTALASSFPSVAISYRRNQAGEWIQQAPIEGSSSQDRFGWGTAVWGGNIVAGAPWHARRDVEGNSHGIACSFERPMLNHPPTALDLSSNSVAEELPADTVVGILSTTDSDPADTFFKYELVPGDGDDDNESFRIGEIRSDRLLTNATFNFQQKSTCHIRIRSTDVSGAEFEKTFTINIINEPDPATIQLSGLVHTYDGTVKAPTVTTTPPGLAYKTSFPELFPKPTNAGTYPFTVEITQGEYFGSASGSLTIEKASQEISLGISETVVIRDYIQTPAERINVTASSGLPVLLTSSDPSVITVQKNSFGKWELLPVAPGTATVTASQTGNSNYLPAPNVSQVVNVVTNFSQIVIPESVTELPFTDVPYNGDFRSSTLALDGEVLMTAGRYLEAGKIYQRHSPGNWQLVRESTTYPNQKVAAGNGTLAMFTGSFEKILEIFCDGNASHPIQPALVDLEQDGTLLGGPSDIRSSAVHGNLMLVGRSTFDPDEDDSFTSVNDLRGDILVFARQPDCEWVLLSTFNLDQDPASQLLSEFEESQRAFVRAGLGYRIATDGETALISSGSTVFMAQVGNAGLEQLEILPDTRAKLVVSLVVEGNLAAVGYTGQIQSANLPGIVDIYERAPNGTWSRTSSVSPPDTDSANFFGLDIDLSNGVLAVTGAGPIPIGEVTNAYLFEKDAEEEWQLLLEIPAEDTSFGQIEIDGNIVAVADSEKVTIFEMNRLASQPFDKLTEQTFHGLPVNSPLRNLSADPDNDNRSTLEEIATGTDPFTPDEMKPANNSLPFFSMTGDNAPVLSFTVPNPVPKILYRVECSTTLGENESWHRVAPETTRVIHRNATHSTIRMQFAPLPVGAKEFFRMVFEIPE